MLLPVCVAALIPRISPHLSKDHTNIFIHYYTWTLVVVLGVFPWEAQELFKLFEILNRECPCSYFARRLFCRCTNIPHKLSFVRALWNISSAFILMCCLSAWGSSSSSLQDWDRKKPFLTALVDWLLSSALYSKNRVLFSQCLHHPCCNLLAKKKKSFFYWFGRPGVFFLCVNVYILLNKMGSFLRAGAFSVHVILRVNGSLYATGSTSSK